MSRRRTQLLPLALVALAAAAIALALPAAATSAPPGCANRTNTTYQTLLQCVTLEGVRAHQAAFQEIANDNDDLVGAGTRAAGTSGLNAMSGLNFQVPLFENLTSHIQAIDD